MRITELKSDNSSAESQDDDKDRLVNDAWYEQHDRLQRIEQTFEVNKAAREKRRLRNINDNQQFPVSFCEEEAYDTQFRNDFAYSDFYGSGSNDVVRDSVLLNHQRNCFTIIDKRYACNSESTSESEYADIELLNCGNSGETEQAGRDDMPYDRERDTDKHTVWIYSFKNKHLLSENDFELVNIPSQETSNTTPSSIEDVEKLQIEKDSCCRIPTPIPSSYVPRLNLNLTPTLPTVTEVTEPKKQSSSNQTEKQSIENGVKPKTVNNWFLSERVIPSNKDTEFEQSTNVINWMALSPREKRRKFINRNPITRQVNLATVREVSSYAENKVECRGDNSRKLQPTVHVHEIEVEQNASKNSVKTPINSNIQLRSIKIDDSIENAIRTESEESVPDDRGDGNNKNRRARPKIRLSPKPVAGLGITDPIEKLDGDHWIAEEKLEQPGDKYQKNKKYISPAHFHGDCAGNTLLRRNISLLKPAEWTEYLPITESLPSLNLTMTSNSDEAPLPWFRRLIKFFRCCK